MDNSVIGRKKTEGKKFRNCSELNSYVEGKRKVTVILNNTISNNGENLRGKNEETERQTEMDAAFSDHFLSDKVFFLLDKVC